MLVRPCCSEKIHPSQVNIASQSQKPQLQWTQAETTPHPPKRRSSRIELVLVTTGSRTQERSSGPFPTPPSHMPPGDSDHLHWEQRSSVSQHHKSSPGKTQAGPARVTPQLGGKWGIRKGSPRSSTEDRTPQKESSRQEPSPHRGSRRSRTWTSVPTDIISSGSLFPSGTGRPDGCRRSWRPHLLLSSTTPSDFSPADLVPTHSPDFTAGPHSRPRGSLWTQERAQPPAGARGPRAALHEVPKHQKEVLASLPLERAIPRTSCMVPRRPGASVDNQSGHTPCLPTPLPCLPDHPPDKRLAAKFSTRGPPAGTSNKMLCTY